jgi:hypothetical protein
MGLNITVDFKKLGGLALSDPGPPTGSAVNRNYDNGYNRVDSSGNAGNLTWYWGYQNPNSVVGDNLSLQSYRTPANATSSNHSDDPQSGVEIFYQRELKRGKRWRLGAEAAAGYTYISVSDSSTLKNKSYRTNDTFALGGIIAPLAPYNGTFQGPGALIGSAPADRTTDVLAGSATIVGNRNLESDVFLFRLGPYLEYQLTERFSLIANGGLTLAVTRTDFSFNEIVTISDPGNDINLVSSRRSGSGTETDFLVGGYVGGGIQYALTRQINLVAGARYQMAGETVSTEGGKRGLLDLGKSIIVTLGASYSF